MMPTGTAEAQRIAELEDTVERLADHVDTLAWLHAELIHRIATLLSTAAVMAERQRHVNAANALTARLANGRPKA